MSMWWPHTSFFLRYAVIFERYAVIRNDEQLRTATARG